MKVLTQLVTPLLLVTALTYANAAPQPKEKTLDKPVQLYINTLHKRYNFSKDYLTTLFKQAKYQERIIANMTHPYEQKPWYQYRDFFMTPKRINNGVAFWQMHQKIFNEAEKKYGVPASVILAIMGVETLYGERKGSYRVLDSLTTLAFHFPKRAKFFKHELTNYLLLTREQQLHPLSVTGLLCRSNWNTTVYAEHVP